MTITVSAAIVLGEKTAGRWMNGSGFFRRTQPDNSGCALETAGADETVQIAIVYRGRQVSIFRNGKPYADYKVEKPMEFSRKAFVLLGLRYLGPDGAIGPLSGAIEEARIYDQPLDAKTIAELRPGKVSQTKPLAMWSFEDGAPGDSIKTFPRTTLCGGARIADGKLHLSGAKAFLIAQRAFDPKEPNPATKPAPRPANAQAWWKRHNMQKKQIARGDALLLMIGDSITHMWDAGWARGKGFWNRHYRPRKAVNLGISGDATQTVLWRLQNLGLDKVKPKAAVIMIGTNNRTRPDQTVEGVKVIVDYLKKTQPQMKILLLAIFPREGPHSYRRQENDKVNKIIAACADGKQVVFLDLAKHFVDKNGGLSKAIMPDGLHPSTKGFGIWAKAMEPTLKELMGEGKK